MSKKLLSLILSNAGCPTQTCEQGTGPINISFDAKDGLVIRRLIVNFTAKPTAEEDLVIRHQDPARGAQFDALAFQQDMSGNKSVVITDPIFMAKGDRLVLECDNSGNVPWGIKVIHGRNS